MGSPGLGDRDMRKLAIALLEALGLGLRMPEILEVKVAIALPFIQELAVPVRGR